ncbi:MAG: protein translocase subunit SecD, partial [Ignavibacteria bacterium]|nr:protein translocase subunit SecD [Ignavibacteria bacterium]
MKEFRFRLIIIAAAIGLSIFLLFPTYKGCQDSQEISKILDQKRKEIKESNPDISAEELNDIIKENEDSI